MKKERKFSLGRLFHNDRFVLIFSVFAAIILWFVMSITNTEERPRTIHDVPITIPLSADAEEQGYRVFSQSDTTARVMVTGNSLIVNQLEPEDLVVRAQLPTITRPGDFTFNLVAEPQNPNSSYEIVSVDPGSVIVYIDRYKEATFEIENNIKYTRVDDRYYVGTPQLSVTNVKISGPETEINKVAKISVESEIQETLTQTYRFTTQLVMWDSQGDVITSDLIEMSVEEGKVDVTVPVWEKQELPVEVNFVNKPSDLQMGGLVTVDHETIEVGVPPNQTGGLTAISLSPIDFSNVSPSNNVFTLDIDLPQEYQNLNNITSVNVQLDLSDFGTKTINIPAENILVKNVASGKFAQVTTQNLTVTVVAPTDMLEEITASHIHGEIDMTGQESLVGSAEMPVKISIQSGYQAWAYGTYRANVNIQTS